MFLLLKSKNNSAKKNLYLLYSKGNKSAYPTTAKVMARYLSTHYHNKTICHQCDKMGIRTERREMTPNLKTRTTTLQVLQVRTLEKLQHLKIPLFLAMDLASVLRSRKAPSTSLGQYNLKKN